MSLRKTLKKIGRKTAAIHVKINRVAVPVVAAAGTYFGGPVVGAAVTAVGASASTYFRATQARNEGTFGREARALGRGERKRVALYGAAGTGAGWATSIAVGALGYAGSGAAGNALAGTSGSSALFGPQSSALTAAQIAANAPTQVMVPGVGQMTLPMSQAAAVAQSTGGTLLGTQALAPTVAGAGLSATEILGATNTLFEAYKKATPGNTIPTLPKGPTIPPNGPNSNGGGEDNGGTPTFRNGPTGKNGEVTDGNGGLIVAAIIGAIIFLG